MIDTVIRLQKAPSLPQDAHEFEAFMWAPYRLKIIPRSERAIWRSAPHDCADAQALHDAAMRLAGSSGAVSMARDAGREREAGGASVVIDGVSSG